MRMVVVMTAVCGAAPEEPPASERPLGSAQLVRSERPIAEQYIVVLREDGDSRAHVPTVARELADRHGGIVLFTYQSALPGFAVRMPEARLQALLKDPRVDYVEEDGAVQLDSGFSIAAATPWGLDRIDERTLPLDGAYRPARTGSGVNAYIIDTGIQMTHAEFGGRAVKAIDIVTPGGTANDCQGNGTAMAAIVGGSTYGVAKGVTLRAVRVLDCAGSGTYSAIISGIDWVRTNHIKPAVAYLGLTANSTTVRDAVTNAVAAGVSFVVAAGDTNVSACNVTPANVASALTVGATTSTDARTAYSNFGSCLDFFAPGASIPTVGGLRSGTPVAAAHVAGAAALVLQANPSATPATVTSTLLTDATSGVVGTPGVGSPNRLLYVPPLPLSITSPTGGSTVSGTVSVNALTTEGLTVTHVEFSAGSCLIGADTSAPYGVSWNTTSLPGGTHSLTARAFNGTTLVGTSTVSVTVSATGSAQLLANPNFDDGPVSWTASPASVLNSASFPPPLSSPFKAWLGGSNSPLTFVSQDFAVPAAACGATLDFQLKLDSFDFAPNDYLVVQLRDTANNVLQTVYETDNLAPGFFDYAPVSRTLNLSAYRGMTLRLHFESNESPFDSTSFFVDNTSLRLTP